MGLFVRVLHERHLHNPQAYPYSLEDLGDTEYVKLLVVSKIVPTIIDTERFNATVRINFVAQCIDFPGLTILRTGQ